MIPRLPGATAVVLVFAIIVQVAACLPAATARGYPAIDPFWHWTPYLACLSVFWLPFFDDDPGGRRASRWIYAIVAAIGFGSVMDYGIVPRSNDPLITIISALFIAPISIPTIMAGEVAANWFWSRVRGFSTDAEFVGSPRFRFNLIAMFGAMAAVAALLGMFRFISSRPASWGEIDVHSRTNLRTIVEALDIYRQHHGDLPQDARGADYAIYKLRDMIEASAFDAAPRKAHRANWDDVAKKIQGADFLYLNKTMATDDEIVLVSQSKYSSGYALVSTFSHSGIYVHPRGADPARLLGSYCVDGVLIVNDPAVVADYRQTHPANLSFNGSDSTSSGAETVTNVSYAKGLSMRFVTGPFERPISCTIRSAPPIVETYDLDEMGRVCGVKRTPDNWKVLWQIANPPAGPLATSGAPAAVTPGAPNRTPAKAPPVPSE